MHSAARPLLVVYGAFDRHNLGDLLFARVADALLAGETLVHAGLADRDLRADGGVQVVARSSLAEALAGRPAVRVLHAGGELLTCSAWQAAVMLRQPADERLQPMLAWLEAHPAERAGWVRRTLGCDDAVPYVLGRRSLPGRTERIAHVGLGGVDLDACGETMHAEAIAKLRDADFVAVRDARTQSHLEAAGIAAQLVPDPVQLVAELFGDEIARHAQRGEVAALRRQMPQGGHLAVQFSAEFGDDATLDALAAALGRVAAARGLGLALFRAGAAPWHDDLGVYRRFASRMPRAVPVALLASTHVFDACAVVATARGYVGSSLHGRIVAMAHGVPRLNLHRDVDARCIDKQRAYAATWEAPGSAASVRVGTLADMADAALDADPAELSVTARRLAAAVREGFATVCAVLR